MNVLVTGGAGYIGSHTVRLLAAQGHEVTVYDNLSKGHAQAVAGHKLVEGDLFDREGLLHVLRQNAVEAVVHFAAFSLVGESMSRPLDYYHNNVSGTLQLLAAMKETGVKQLVFSSTAAVYGDPGAGLITEDTPKQPSNVYGRTKLIMEQAMQDFSDAYGLRYTALRYFNACGADPTGDIGEDHRPESHLIPLILQACLGQRESIRIFGEDYPTPDGTCLRDYIHVNDLAQAHSLALDALAAGAPLSIYNLGNGTGFSVREIISAAEEVTGVTLKKEAEGRRPGDPPQLVAASDKIRKNLGWKPIYTDIKGIIADAWRWHSKHPNGYHQ